MYKQLCLYSLLISPGLGPVSLEIMRNETK